MNTLQNLLIVLAIIMIIGSGLIHGRLSQRWGGTASMEMASDTLQMLPHTIGAWSLSQEFELSESTQEMLQCVGFVNAAYVHTSTGQIVRVAVLLGASGPIAVHTPEVCYSSRNYAQIHNREKVTLECAGSDDSFWAITFRENNPSERRLRVYYAWTNDHIWEAAENPRFQYAGTLGLYKIQLACQLPAYEDPHAGVVCIEFLREFVPILRDYLTLNTLQSNPTEAFQSLK